MTMVTSFRDAFLMFIGAFIGAAGAAIAVIGGLNVPFPWKVACIVAGLLLLFVGQKLFHKGADF